ncbi:MAG: hypothetical protein KVP17_005115 [Porospora cf. gigantea B]|uniref:uncharacterized protein n=1 Tax=Porospora cf. gigantea B TaxID=2853592 RepID=UPI003571CA44|nr:MAG: hypothetical protein KVP17_005115 [Porospora cf. gigantea B]
MTSSGSSLTPTSSVASGGSFERELANARTPGWVLPVAAALIVITGTCNTLGVKWQNKQCVPSCSSFVEIPSVGVQCGDADDGLPFYPLDYDCRPRYFEAPWWQTVLMYFGELLCLFVWLIDMRIKKRKGLKVGTFDFPNSSESFSKPESPYYLWLVPTAIDFVSSAMINYASVLAFASTVQMLRNFNVIITAFLSLVVVRVALRVYQWTGVVVISIGLAITGIFAVANPEEDNNATEMQWLGLVFSLVGTILSAFQFVFEERLFRSYYISPLKAIGLQGIFGLIIGAVILTIAQFTGLEDTKLTFYQISQSGALVGGNVLFTCSVAIFNGAGLTTSKLGSGLLRTVIITLRSVTVWLLELCFSWVTFDWLQFISLILLIIGTFLYNDIWFKMGSCQAKWERPLVCCKFLRNPDLILVDDFANAEEEETSEMSV